jgi:hypothetical protein
MTEIDELGPIDYLVVEWPEGTAPDGKAFPHLVQLVENGIIHILDLAFVSKSADGEVIGLSLDEVSQDAVELQVFEGVSAGVLDDSDLADAAEAISPGTSAAVIVYENTWAAPFAVALRKSGAQVVANGRVPVQQIVASIEAAS